MTVGLCDLGYPEVDGCVLHLLPLNVTDMHRKATESLTTKKSYNYKITLEPLVCTFGFLLEARHYR
ncbi:hypothetical protein K443DRAFT_401189 [Laccaria amethystina LaAM-08-1]|uniref:Uncharacterized protein n=1 Tax=Laccaria amethystina LaAM-08-1 TaxID=1095629 RepID=A0A0C9WQG3_9AGAR|nr:hypothetical protein K443DRAFT_401189 [Laccaria amethystina LaAM-08-1]